MTWAWSPIWPWLVWTIIGFLEYFDCVHSRDISWQEIFCKLKITCQIFIGAVFAWLWYIRECCISGVQIVTMTLYHIWWYSPICGRSWQDCCISKKKQNLGHVLCSKQCCWNGQCYHKATNVELDYNMILSFNKTAYGSLE